MTEKKKYDAPVMKAYPMKPASIISTSTMGTTVNESFDEVDVSEVWF